MDVQIDMRVAELLSSRLCHDLVGPIGAVNNGLELIEDEDPGMLDEALKLTATSARQAANTLQFFRLAYGLAGDRVGSNLSELHDLAANYLGSGKIKLNWSVETGPNDAPSGLGKLLLNMIALAAEGLPKGGTLDVEANPSAAALPVFVIATGPGATLREEILLGLQPDSPVADLTPRSVQGYFTRILAQRSGSDLAIDTAKPERVSIGVTLRY